MIYTFSVPGAPVPKGRPRIVNGRGYTPRKTTKAQHLIQIYAMLAKVKPQPGPITLTVVFALTNRRRTDLDNLTKTVMDALNRVAWQDDSQITSLYASKVFGTEPSTLITIEAL